MYSLYDLKSNKRFNEHLLINYDYNYKFTNNKQDYYIINNLINKDVIDLPNTICSFLNDLLYIKNRNENYIDITFVYSERILSYSFENSKYLFLKYLFKIINFSIYEKMIYKFSSYIELYNTTLYNKNDYYNLYKIFKFIKKNVINFKILYNTYSINKLIKNKYYNKKIKKIFNIEKFNPKYSLDETVKLKNVKIILKTQNILEIMISYLFNFYTPEFIKILHYIYKNNYKIKIKSWIPLNYKYLENKHKQLFIKSYLKINISKKFYDMRLINNNIYNKNIKFIT